MTTSPGGKTVHFRVTALAFQAWRKVIANKENEIDQSDGFADIHPRDKIDGRYTKIDVCELDYRVDWDQSSYADYPRRLVYGIRYVKNKFYLICSVGLLKCPA